MEQKSKHVYIVRWRSRIPTVVGYREMDYGPDEAAKAEEDFKMLAVQGYDVEFIQRVITTTDHVIFHSGYKLGEEK